MTRVSALDVADYVLSKQPGPITTMKLQKLCYYAQAWHLAWTGKPLFEEPIEAWANGPVVHALFDKHRGTYSIAAGQLPGGDESRLSESAKAMIDVVLGTYGDMSAVQLSLLTHAEAPWQQARGQLSSAAKTHAEISWQSMIDYYRSLSHSDDAVHTVEDVNFPAWA